MGAPITVLIQKHQFANRDRKTFVANGQLVFDVIRGNYLTRIIARLRGNLVVSGGISSGTSLGPNPGNLIRFWTVLASPAGQIKRLMPRSVISRTLFDYGVLKGAGTALTGAAGTFTLDHNVYLQFAAPGLARPIDSALETQAFTSIQLIADLGGRDTQFSGNDRFFDFSSTTIDIIDDRELMTGRTALLYEDDFVKSISAANPNFHVTEFPLGTRYVDILMAAETTNQALADTIINRIRTQAGGLNFHDSFSLDIQAQNDQYRKDAASALTGLYFLPFSPDGLLRGALDAQRLSQVAAVLDVSNPGTDRLVISSRRVLLAEDLPA